jgi:hypothetical protein
MRQELRLTPSCGVPAGIEGGLPGRVAQSTPARPLGSLTEEQIKARRTEAPGDGPVPGRVRGGHVARVIRLPKICRYTGLVQHTVTSVTARARQEPRQTRARGAAGERRRAAGNEAGANVAINSGFRRGRLAPARLLVADDHEDHGEDQQRVVHVAAAGHGRDCADGEHDSAATSPHFAFGRPVMAPPAAVSELSWLRANVGLASGNRHDSVPCRHARATRRAGGRRRLKP